MNLVGNGGVAGTTGRSLAIEALKLNVSSSVSGGIEYSAHVQDVGWQGWTSNGNVAGTVGCAKRIEALKIRLTGDVSSILPRLWMARLDLKWAACGYV